VGWRVRSRSTYGTAAKDYDVATSATPTQIRDVFGHRKTLAIGAAFGVITVLGGKRSGNVEIATFRRDAEYSDGRHPDHVTFSSAEEDARRRDFTINGLFHDPLIGRDIDYVGGAEDLQGKIIRAIGDPHQRVGEDKLRMLRAVRFAAAFDFSIERETFAALQQHAHELKVVSAERIAEEMRRMLVPPSRRTAIELLDETGLIEVIVPEIRESRNRPSDGVRRDAWKQMLNILTSLDTPTFPAALAVLLRDSECAENIREDETRLNESLNREAAREHPLNAFVTAICQRLRLSSNETSGTLFCLRYEMLIRRAHQLAWPRVQRVLTSDRVDELLSYAAAVSGVLDDDRRGVDYCRDKPALPAEQWNPVPLVTGDDLKAAGLRPGPEFRRILDGVRDAQLDGTITTVSQALAEAERLSRMRPSL